MPKIAELLSDEVRRALMRPSTERHVHVDPKGVRVHRLTTKHPVPPEPRAYRAPRMGNVPKFRSGNTDDVCLSVRQHGARSGAVAFVSYETRNFPK